ncbi:MAG: hypothetical protein KatS3mg118_3246 [Paracoccaceae bacterium]|nr:MAG: hypothetical protein KatS3mg118_3246 [Paracoccaceae bacterium]
MRRNLILATVLGTMALSGAGLAVAAGTGGKDKEDLMEAQALQAARVQLADAGRIALQAVPGTLSEVGFEVEKGKAVWEASVIARDGTETEVLIDADTGKVIAKKMADEDEDGDHDGEGSEAHAG